MFQLILRTPENMQPRNLSWQVTFREKLSTETDLAPICPREICLGE